MRRQEYENYKGGRVPRENFSDRFAGCSDNVRPPQRRLRRRKEIITDRGQIERLRSTTEEFLALAVSEEKHKKFESDSEAGSSSFQECEEPSVLSGSCDTPHPQEDEANVYETCEKSPFAERFGVRSQLTAKCANDSTKSAICEKVVQSKITTSPSISSSVLIKKSPLGNRSRPPAVVESLFQGGAIKAAVTPLPFGIITKGVEAPSQSKLELWLRHRVNAPKAVNTVEAVLYDLLTAFYPTTTFSCVPLARTNNISFGNMEDSQNSSTGISPTTPEGLIVAPPTLTRLICTQARLSATILTLAHTLPIFTARDLEIELLVRERVDNLMQLGIGIHNILELEIVSRFFPTLECYNRAREARISTSSTSRPFSLGEFAPKISTECADSIPKIVTTDFIEFLQLVLRGDFPDVSPTLFNSGMGLSSVAIVNAFAQYWNKYRATRDTARFRDARSVPIFIANLPYIVATVKEAVFSSRSSVWICSKLLSASFDRNNSKSDSDEPQLRLRDCNLSKIQKEESGTAIKQKINIKDTTETVKKVRAQDGRVHLVVNFDEGENSKSEGVNGSSYAAVEPKILSQKPLSCFIYNSWAINFLAWHALGGENNSEFWMPPRDVVTRVFKQCNNFKLCNLSSLCAAVVNATGFEHPSFVLVVKELVYALRKDKSASPNSESCLASLFLQSIQISVLHYLYECSPNEKLISELLMLSTTPWLFADNEHLAPIRLCVERQVDSLCVAGDFLHLAKDSDSLLLRVSRRIVFKCRSPGDRVDVEPLWELEAVSVQKPSHTILGFLGALVNPLCSSTLKSLLNAIKETIPESQLHKYEAFILSIYREACRYVVTPGRSVIQEVFDGQIFNSVYKFQKAGFVPLLESCFLYSPSTNKDLSERLGGGDLLLGSFACTPCELSDQEAYLCAADELHEFVIEKQAQSGMDSSIVDFAALRMLHLGIWARTDENVQLLLRLTCLPETAIKRDDFTGIWGAHIELATIYASPSPSSWGKDSFGWFPFPLGSSLSGVDACVLLRLFELLCATAAAAQNLAVFFSKTPKLLTDLSRSIPVPVPILDVTLAVDADCSGASVKSITGGLVSSREVVVVPNMRIVLECISQLASAKLSNLNSGGERDPLFNKNRSIVLHLPPMIVLTCPQMNYTERVLGRLKRTPNSFVFCVFDNILSRNQLTGNNVNNTVSRIGMLPLLQAVSGLRVGRDAKSEVGIQFGMDPYIRAPMALRYLLFSILGCIDGSGFSVIDSTCSLNRFPLSAKLSNIHTASRSLIDECDSSESEESEQNKFEKQKPTNNIMPFSHFDRVVSVGISVGFSSIASKASTQLLRHIYACMPILQTLTLLCAAGGTGFRSTGQLHICEHCYFNTSSGAVSATTSAVLSARCARFQSVVCHAPELLWSLSSPQGVVSIRIPVRSAFCNTTSSTVAAFPSRDISVDHVEMNVGPSTLYVNDSSTSVTDATSLAIADATSEMLMLPSYYSPVVHQIMRILCRAVIGHDDGGKLAISDGCKALSFARKILGAARESFSVYVPTVFDRINALTSSGTGGSEKRLSHLPIPYDPTNVYWRAWLSQEIPVELTTEGLWTVLSAIETYRLMSAVGGSQLDTLTKRSVLESLQKSLQKAASKQNEASIVPPLWAIPIVPLRPQLTFPPSLTPITNAEISLPFLLDHKNRYYLDCDSSQETMTLVPEVPAAVLRRLSTYNAVDSAENLMVVQQDAKEALIRAGLARELPVVRRCPTKRLRNDSESDEEGSEGQNKEFLSFGNHDGDRPSTKGGSGSKRNCVFGRQDSQDTKLDITRISYESNARVAASSFGDSNLTRIVLHTPTPSFYTDTINTSNVFCNNMSSLYSRAAEKHVYDCLARALEIARRSGDLSWLLSERQGLSFGGETFDTVGLPLPTRDALSGSPRSSSVNLELLRYVWVNKEKELGVPYDIVLLRMQGSEVVEAVDFIEVKATNTASKNNFELSLRELMLAERCKNRFCITRVYSAYDKAVAAREEEIRRNLRGMRCESFRDPITLWQKHARLNISANISVSIV